jgi:hypothetical protein
MDEQEGDAIPMPAETYRVILNAPNYSCTLAGSDDAGWYLHEVDGADSRVSRKTYATEAEAVADFENDAVEWNSWNT